MFRRDFLMQASISVAAIAAGCDGNAPGPAAPGSRQAMIDAHCHVFNASDLPATRFLRQVVFEDFPKQAANRILAVRDPDVTDRFIELILHLLGADRAPSADEESAFLRGSAPARASALTVENARSAAIEDTTQFLLSIDQRQRNAVTAGSPSNLTISRKLGDEKFLNYMLGASTTDLRADTALSPLRARAASRQAFARENAVGRYLNWFSLFRLYRHVLLERLIADTQREGFNPIMLTPALVDYDEWLYEDVRSPLARQMVVMDLLFQRFVKQPNSPVVHGYIGFDPLREVAHRAGHKGSVSSLETARTALTEHGFIGVKLYPPMGFRPSGNRPPYPERTVKSLGFLPDKELDLALEDLYTLCVELDAPILAHGYSSNGSGPDYAKRGDPAYWIPVFETFPKLRACLAHFGSFDARSAGRETMPLPEGSWEWRLGEFIKANPRHNVFADISYFAEVLSADVVLRHTLADSFKRWTMTFDPGVDHLIFGSDWIMVGKEDGYEHYVASVNAFLRTDCGFSDDVCDKIFRRNALRFLPLERWSKGRDRLVSWYRSNGLDEKRLPSAPARLFADLLGR